MSLPVEVRDKIVSTFRHTLDLYRDGKLDDCLIGCDFILKMDPRFAPARKLQEKARNPKADVDVAELQAAIAGPGAAPPPRADAIGTLSLDEPGAHAPSPSILSETGGGADGSGLGGLEDLSLDSLSLDGPLSDMSPHPARGESGLPFEPGSPGNAFPGLTTGALAADPGLSGGEDVDPEAEIASLLKRGDDARSAGDRQQAIEIWSRIFLIDINNTDAVSRIENTRAEMSEESHRLAASLEKGQESYARGDLAAARTQFDAVLSLGEEPPASRPVPPPAPLPVPPSPHDLSAVATPADVLAEELDQSGPPGARRSWTSIPRPSRGSEPAVETAPPGAEPAKRLALRVSPRVAMIAGAGLAVVVLLLFFLLRSPRSASPAAQAASGPTLEHATQLFREGKIDETTAELRQIPRSHPDYARAQKLLASLTDSKEAAPPAPSGGTAPPPSSAEASPGSDPAALRAEGLRALSDKRYIDALKSFSAAAPHFSGDPTFNQEMGKALEKVSELTPAVKLYNDGEYETAIPILWRIYQASRDNKDAQSYLLRAYYNQGILQLQNGLYDRAQQSFGEVLALDPQDVDSARHRQFAERYRGRDLDLLGRIYVRYISPRP
ncbi:MAG TPA: tetratricopeptide repeat protein [Thermoanaerobaculia bacterium]